jgi:hypothetical protein
MPEMFARVHDNYVLSYYKTGHKKLIGTPRQLTGKRKDGSPFQIMVSLGEVAQHKAGESNCAFVAICREASAPLSSFDAMNQAMSDSSNSLHKTDSQESLVSVLTVNSEYKQLNQEEMPKRNSLRKSLVNEDLFLSFKTKLESKFEECLGALKQHLGDSLEEFDKTLIVSNHRLEILEQENQRLMAQVEVQNEEIKRLNKEIEILSKSNGRCSILQILRRNGSYLAFLSYCMEKKCAEAVMFWREVEDFRNRSYAHKEDMKRDANSILFKYLEQGAPCQVNTSAELVQEVKNKLQQGEIGKTLFVPVQDNIVAKLNEDIFSDFCNSAQGKSAIELLYNSH